MLANTDLHYYFILSFLETFAFIASRTFLNTVWRRLLEKFKIFISCLLGNLYGICFKLLRIGIFCIIRSFLIRSDKQSQSLMVGHSFLFLN